MRNYKRKPGRVNPDRRMARVIELHAEGLSNYQIADRLSCSEITVRRDLVRWERDHSNVTSLRHLPATFSPPRGKDVAPECRSEPTNVVAINDRRKRA
jgi:transposase